MLIHNSTDTQLKKACESGQFFGQLKKDGNSINIIALML